MRKSISLIVFFVIALHAFGHAGEVHNYMGTITMVHSDGSFMLEKTDGKTMHVAVSKSTSYLHADGTAAGRDDVTAGTRAVVTISKDGKTATRVKLAASRK
jgi:hypothetical protein